MWISVNLSFYLPLMSCEPCKSSVQKMTGKMRGVQTVQNDEMDVLNLP